MKDQIVKLLLDNKSYNEIVGILGCSKATISYHARKMGRAKFVQRSYDWQTISNQLNSGETLTKVQKEYGFAKASFDKALKSGKIDDKRKLTSRMNAEQYSNHYANKLATPAIRRGLKRRLVVDGKPEICDNPLCGISEWLGHKVPLELDHVDGNSSNNKLNNLRFLCLHCHSQTDTWRGRNTKAQRAKRNTAGFTGRSGRLSLKQE